MITEIIGAGQALMKKYSSLLPFEKQSQLTSGCQLT
jgi:hypothetical protein